MAFHLLPFLLAKVAGKYAAKKAIAHHTVGQVLGKKVAQEAAKQGAVSAVRSGWRRRGKEDDSGKR